MKTIIVPVDFSEYSEYALNAAAILAKKHDSDIIMLHMLELSTVHAYGEETQKEHVEKELFYTKLAERKFDEFLSKDYLKGISVTPIIRNFKVFSELGEVAEQNHADLIVMGSKGSSGLTEFFIGSNTEKVVRHSEIPVLVIKNKPVNWDIKKIVFATDFSEESTPSFIAAMALLDSLKAEVQILYVNVPGEGFRASDEMEWTVETFLEQAEGNLDRINSVHYIADKSAEKGILKYAKKVNADVVAVTTHGRKGLARFFEGSISEDLVNHAKFAILTFKI